jgi:rare lipoprotein A
MCLSQGHARATTIQGLSPEVQSTVWQEESQELASVSLNGKELITFRCEAGNGSASTKADELAGKLQDLLEDKKFDANTILPAKSGALSTVQRDGNTVISFDSGSTSSDEDSTALVTSWKVVNVIRTAFGVPLLPSSYLKLVDQAEQKVAADGVNGTFSGQASWYGGQFHGRKTSDGHRYDQEKMTAAHRSLPFGTKLLVMNRKTGTSCIVEVNDRGPFVADRVIDLSRAAARQLNMLSSGVALVDCLVIGGQ